MITWFDALLVTLLAVMTALGARRGLSGLVWGVGVLAICLVAGALGAGMWASLGLALLLGTGAAFAISRLIPDPLASPIHVVLGALGGLLLGTLLSCTIALNFPLRMKATPRGTELLYPSDGMHSVLYQAVSNSSIKNHLNSVWTSNPALKTLLIPDRVVKK